MDGKSLCYSIGFYTENSQCKIYYINEDLNTVDIIQDCIFELLKSKYDPYTFYCHNFGRCDAPFILKALIEFNKTCENKDKYYFDILTRDATIIRLKVKRRIEGKVRSVRIHDSLPILSNSLRDLCTYYKIDDSKTYFPYNFLNENTLWYEGVRSTPYKSYYGQISDRDLNEFEE